MNESVLVMLIEDNLDHAELVMRTLADHQVANQIRHFSEGLSALDYLYRRGEYSDPAKSPRPNLILLDLRLPRIDGLEILKEIKSTDELRSIPVVVLTTSEAERDIARAYLNHANSYLVKPVGFEEFNQLMEDMGFYWLRWNTSPVV